MDSDPAAPAVSSKRCGAALVSERSFDRELPVNPIMVSPVTPGNESPAIWSMKLPVPTSTDAETWSVIRTGAWVAPGRTPRSPRVSCRAVEAAGTASGTMVAAAGAVALKPRVTAREAAIRPRIKNADEPRGPPAEEVRGATGVAPRRV